MSEEKRQELKEAIEKINSMVKEDEEARSLIIIGFKETTSISMTEKDRISIITTLSNALYQNERLMYLMKAAISVAEDYQIETEKQKNKKKNQ